MSALPAPETSALPAPETTSPLDADAFRRTARAWSTGVALLTAADGEEVFAKTVSSLCTLSLDPPLVSVAVDRRSPLAAAVRRTGRYAVGVLAGPQEPLARRFAARGAGRALGRFPGVPLTPIATGAPVLTDCLGWFDCVLDAALGGGDHVLLVGQVAAAGGDGGEPLLYHAGRYRLLHPAAPPPSDPASASVPSHPLREPAHDPAHR
ncbi:flavin reductase family protein [Streptomyces solincola]|uniref:flavin reductase family protein n=1 Tax=Streptomyces solincola TaxID=2100817 RepID=UPI0015E47722|nr:flavin reductase family protein [Streptomyces solincola]